MRILLIEDEPAICEQLGRVLSADGFRLEVAEDGEKGRYLGLEYTFDVAVIDLGLPKVTGLELIKEFREAGKSFPILVLTARSDWKTKVEALNLGADDYLVKPFQTEELQARLQALIRRSAGFSSSEMQVGGLCLDTKTQQVTMNERVLDLTAYEYKILEYMMLHSTEVITKTALIDYLYDQDFDRDSNVIEVFMARLRKKLDPEGKLKIIETLRGRGYQFNLDDLS
ncbi:MAG: response regulator transcription factor [Gammaproteobacteria bacterium]|nr:response regulator transcription factor [Gammaproteobacteria bacterium]